MKMAGDPGFGALVLEHLGDFPRRHGLEVTRHVPGVLAMASDHIEIQFIHDRQADCVVRPRGSDAWGSLPHLAANRGLAPGVLTSQTGLNRGGLAKQVELAAMAIETALCDMLTGPIDWWDDYIATAQAYLRHRLGF